MVNKLARGLLGGLFPNHCALCALPCRRQLPLCSDCEDEIPPNLNACARCAIPLPAARDSVGIRLCGTCIHSPPPFHRVVAPWLYGEYLAHLIHCWKYRGDRRLTTLLAHLWLRRASLRDPVDMLVPVPLHWRRLWRRGFNQSELLARQLLRACPELAHCQLAPGLVKRRRATPAQSGIGARQRADNLRDAFTVQEPCDNLRLAVVDDVLTTGATAAAMADALLCAGADHVEIWCLARTPAPGD